MEIKRFVYNLYNFPITNFIMYFKNGHIYVPEYQRELVWNNDQKEMLIDSIMYNIPIGNIFLNQNSKKSLDYEIVDGQQRLMAIWDFYNNKFKWRDLYYKDFGKQMQGMFENASATATYITYYETRAEVIELYYRINWGGIEHTVEEILELDRKYGVKKHDNND